jgi:polyphosphate kinase
VPAEAVHVRAEIEAVFRGLLSDNSQAWELNPDGSWERLRPQSGERRRAAQTRAVRRRLRARRSAQAR